MTVSQLITILEEFSQETEVQVADWLTSWQQCHNGPISLDKVIYYPEEGIIVLQDHEEEIENRKHEIYTQ